MKVGLKANYFFIFRNKYIKCLFLLSTLVLVSGTSSSNVPLNNSNEISIFDAIKASIENNNNIKVTKLVNDITKENIQAQEGQFDYAVVSGVSVSESEIPFVDTRIDGVTDRKNSNQSFTVGVQKQLKSSPIVNLSVTTDSNGDNVLGQKLNQYSNASVNLSLTIPLWRGRGGTITTLPLALSKLNFEASTYDLRHQINTSVLNTVAGYWRYKGVVESLVLLEQSEKKSNILLGEIQELINANELPASELNVVKAQLSRRTGARYQGENNVVSAQAELSNSLGLMYYSDSLATPITPLVVPSELDFDAVLNVNRNKILQRIESNRNDFIAIHVRLDIAKKQIQLADESKKQKLDLTLGSTYRQYEQDNQIFSGLRGDSFGPDWFVQLNFEWRPQQTSALSASQTARLQYQRRVIEKAELHRRAVVELDATLFSIIQSGRLYREAMERQTLSNQNVINERKKLTLGSSTLLDLINIEDRLLQSQLDVIQEQLNYGITLARLMFITGHLNGASNDILVMDVLLGGESFIQALANVNSGLKYSR